jgi:hypothetical protein
MKQGKTFQHPSMRRKVLHWKAIEGKRLATIDTPGGSLRSHFHIVSGPECCFLFVLQLTPVQIGQNSYEHGGIPLSLWLPIGRSPLGAGGIDSTNSLLFGGLPPTNRRDCLLWALSGSGVRILSWTRILRFNGIS